MTKADRLSAALDEFLAVSPDVEAAAIVSADGLPIASALPNDVEEDRLAAMSAALLTLGERAAEGLGRGDLAQVFVEGEQGYVVLMAAGPHAVLVCVTSRSAKVGLVLFEMRRGAAEIASVLAQTSAAFAESAPEQSKPVDAFLPPETAPAGGSNGYSRRPEPEPVAEPSPAATWR